MADDRNEPIVEPIVSHNEIPPDEEVPEAQQICPSCCGTDHLRRTSKKYLHYVPRVFQAKKNGRTKNDTAASTEPVSGKNKELSISITDEDRYSSNKEMLILVQILL